jgi:RNA polymerase sigma factor (TIGR02999 family)
LQPTALVNEAYLRLGGSEGLKFENRAHFFASAAEAMRRILVDSARRNRQLKRGGDQQRVELETRIAAPVEDDKLLLVNEALDLLAKEDAMKAEVVKMRYFIGLQHQQIADALGVSEPTVRRHWAVARVRLFELISQGPGPSRNGSPAKS